LEQHLSKKKFFGIFFLYFGIWKNLNKRIKIKLSLFISSKERLNSQLAIIMIAHRLISVKGFSKVIEISKGKLIKETNQSQLYG